MLDQGFYPDSIWTAPSDEALKNDIWSVHNYERDSQRLRDALTFHEGEKPFRNQPDLAAIRLNNDNTLITLENERQTIEVDKNECPLSSSCHTFEFRRQRCGNSPSIPLPNHSQKCSL